MKIAPIFPEDCDVKLLLEPFKSFFRPCRHYLRSVRFRTSFGEGSLAACERPHTGDGVEIFQHVSNTEIGVNPDLYGLGFMRKAHPITLTPRSK